MADKKIYWVCGYLRPDERDSDFLKYGLKLGEVLRREARDNPALRDFKLVNVYSCTKREFERIWTDPATYGIFWNSHGDQRGRPQADPNPDLPTRREELDSMDLDPRSRVYVVRGSSTAALEREVGKIARRAAASGLPHLVRGYDEGRVRRLDDGRYEIEVTAAALPASSPNLRFIAFMSCWIGKQEAAWRRLMPPGARIPSFPEKNSTAPGAERGWIDDWIDRLKVPHDLFRGLAPSGPRGHSAKAPAGTLRWAAEVLLGSAAHAGTTGAGTATRSATPRVDLTVPPPPYRHGSLGGMTPAGAIGGAGIGGSPADIHSRFRPTPFRRPITVGAGAPGDAGSMAGRDLAAGAPGSAGRRESPFRMDDWWAHGAGTGAAAGGLGGAGGPAGGGASLVSEIHSRYRPSPPRVPIGPEVSTGPRGPSGGDLIVGPITITWSPTHRVTVKPPW